MTREQMLADFHMVQNTLRRILEEMDAQQMWGEATDVSEAMYYVSEAVRGVQGVGAARNAESVDEAGEGTA